MYCRNCGNEMQDEAVVCVKCGVPAGKGTSYCPHCGAEVNPEAVMCVACGTKFAEPEPEMSDKSKLAAGLLGIFLGGLGIHNFYLGYVVKGIVKILMSTLGIALCGLGPFISLVWGFIEGIFILCDNINYDASGRKLRKLGEKKKK